MTEQEYELLLAEYTGTPKPHKPTEPCFDMIPPLAMTEVARVMKYQYKNDNSQWLNPTEVRRKFFNTAQRHQWEYRDGEELDKSSQLHHLAHAIASLMCLYENLIKNPSE